VLLGRGRVPASSAVGVETFNQFFVDKVAKIRLQTEQCATIDVQPRAAWRVVSCVRDADDG